MSVTKDFAKVIQKELDANPPLASAVAEETLKSKISQLIFDYRTMANITQLELADRIGTEESVISKIEDCNY